MDLKGKGQGLHVAKYVGDIRAEIDPKKVNNKNVVNETTSD